ncbi:MAG: [FeFe] hydrogenase H-cluster maturation GTPase HydF [Candidatus Omnitrophica bacterium]|nr:[FeFe] hydrogenase H-cluster maturation GTPase HydF [Candidatus Omnitrophota bacterium]
MNTTPKSLRLHIGIFGRTNVGKSSFLNLITGQDVAITSPVPGTTTDVVEKPMELLPLGPVVFLDTAGLDDTSELSGQRLRKTAKIFDRADVLVLLVEPEIWGDYEDRVITEARQRALPYVVVINKIDTRRPGDVYLSRIREQTAADPVACSCAEPGRRDEFVNAFKQRLMTVCPDELLQSPALIGDLLPAGGCAVLIVPIDLQAPKGRIILPQVQVIRDALDNDAAALVVKEREYAALLNRLKEPPDIVVCDSQVVLKMAADTPSNIACTTFSILFARYKGDLTEMVRGAMALDSLKPGDKVLIAESCTHHPIEDDIGRVKIPRWLRQYLGSDVPVDVCSGRDYPDNLKDYALIIHCGGCMITRREMLFRIYQAKQAGVPITNYGVCISK